MKSKMQIDGLAICQSLGKLAEVAKLSPGLLEVRREVTTTFFSGKFLSKLPNQERLVSSGEESGM